MSTIFDFQTKSGKQKGILVVYILHSLQKKPKSGYDLLREITEKTEGTWVPSKGTIYPLLKHLHEEGMIKIKTVGKRSKHIYEITIDGKKTLFDFKQHGRQMEKKFTQFRKIISEIIAPNKIEIINLIFEIRAASISQIKKNKGDVIKILETCILNLKKIPLDSKEVKINEK